MRKNKGGFNAGRVLLCCMASVVATGCVKNPSDGPKPDDPSAGDYQTFATAQSYAANIDYRLNGYQIGFEVFGENPYEENADGALTKKEVEPYFRGYTDETGHFSGNLTMPSLVTEVWLSSDAIGSVGTAHLKVSGNRIDFDQNEYIAQHAGSKAMTGSGYTYPDDCKVLSEWTDVYGTLPNVLSDNELPASFVARVDKVYSGVVGKFITTVYPELFEDEASADISIESPTKINMVFLKSGASWQNVVGYFTYPTGTVPAADALTKIIAFPNVTKYYKGNSDVRVGSLLAGDRVQLKYWDGTAFQDEFPAGVSIGFFLMGHWFANGNIASYDFAKDIRYSKPDLNPMADGKRQQRTVSLYDRQSGWVAVGFEDNKDWNYTDALFGLQMEHQNAIPGVPDLPEPGADPDTYTEYRGTLAFEDLWPYEGDYDMNDVVVLYKSRVYTDRSNNVSRTVDEFTAKHNGAAYTDGFGYQLHLLGADAVRSVQIESDLAPSSFMKGKSLEPGQDHPTVVLFDDIGVALGHTFTVTTSFTSGIGYERVVPPYNPFAVLKTDEGRGSEVHLVNYPPTALADRTQLHFGHDVSQPDKGLYYVSKNNQFPFAIHIAGYDFRCPKEGTRIDEAYPDFSSWVASGGHKDWYRNPETSLVY